MADEISELKNTIKMMQKEQEQLKEQLENLASLVKDYQHETMRSLDDYLEKINGKNI